MIDVKFEHFSKLFCGDHITCDAYSVRGPTIDL